MKEDIEGAIGRLSKANSDIWYATLYSQEEQDKDIEILIKGYKELKKENEEWQRAYQEEKDKQFELLRENKELKDRIKDFLKNKGVTDIQITAIKHQGYIEGFAQRDKLARELCEDCRNAEKNLRYIPKSKVKEKIEELKHKDFIAIQVCSQHDNKALAQIKVLQELLEREGK